MTKEKELGIFIAEMVNGLPDSGDNFKDCFTLAKALIQRYPQILAEKVWEGEAKFLKALYKNNDSDFVFHNYPSNENKNIEVFIMEVQS